MLLDVIFIRAALKFLHSYSGYQVSSFKTDPFLNCVIDPILAMRAFLVIKRIGQSPSANLFSRRSAEVKKTRNSQRQPRMAPPQIIVDCFVVKQKGKVVAHTVLIFFPFLHTGN